MRLIMIIKINSFEVKFKFVPDNHVQMYQKKILYSNVSHMLSRNFVQKNVKSVDHMIILLAYNFKFSSFHRNRKKKGAQSKACNIRTNFEPGF